MRSTLFASRRVRAAGIHLAVSAAVAAIVAVIVFGYWYPSPFSAIAQGTSIFLLLIGCDVVLGPALTAVVASPKKPTKELRVDLALIVAVQLAAFAYGVYSVAMARPVLLSFEVDSFRVVTAADIDPGALGEAPPSFRDLSWSGPRLIAAVKPKDPNAQLRALDLGLAGIDLSMEPRNWREWPPLADTAWRNARPISLVTERYPQTAAEVSRLASAAGQPVTALRFLPVRVHRGDWIAIVALPGTRILGYLKVDGIF